MLIPKLDAWLAEIVTPDALARAQAPPPEAASRAAAARTALAGCDRRIERLLASIEKGIEADVVAPRILAFRAERARIEATRPDRREIRRLSSGEITAIAQTLGGLMKVLERASPEDRAEVYRQLGVSLAYDPAVRQVRVRADLPRVGCGVEGGT